MNTKVLLMTASILLASCADLLGNNPEPVDIDTATQKFQLKILAEHLQTPWGLDFLPNGQILLTEREGRLLRYNPKTDKVTVIGGLPPIEAVGQGGMMDVAVHPDFQSNQLVYFTYTHRNNKRLYTTRLARGRLEGRKLVDVEPLFEAEPSFNTAVHFGSALLFDNDGFLRMTMGDRLNRHQAQDLSSDLGKTYRLTDEGKPAPGNPFTGISRFSAETYSYGHRNPQGITIDRKTGRIWVAEHGPRGGDEVNVLEMGRNYGWPVITYGREYKGGSIGEGTHKEGMQQPMHYYVPSIATAAIEYYDGTALSGWTDSLFVAGLRSQLLSRIQLKNGEKVFEETILGDRGYRFREVRQGPNGHLYLLAEEGVLLEIMP